MLKKILFIIFVIGSLGVYSYSYSEVVYYSNNAGEVVFGYEKVCSGTDCKVVYYSGVETGVCSSNGLCKFSTYEGYSAYLNFKNNKLIDGYFVKNNHKQNRLCVSWVGACIEIKNNLIKLSY